MSASLEKLLQTHKYTDGQTFVGPMRHNNFNAGEPRPQTLLTWLVVVVVVVVAAFFQRSIFLLYCPNLDCVIS